MTNRESIIKIIESEPRLNQYNLLEGALKLVPIIAKFCKLYNTEFEAVGISTENTKPGSEVTFEPVFYFNDQSGQYTKKSLLNSVLGEEGENSCKL